MNKSVKSTFSNIQNRLTTYDATIAAVFSALRRELEQARKGAAQFKNEAAEFESRKSKAIANARAKISEAEQELSGLFKEKLLPELQQHIADRVAQKPNGDFTETLRLYQEFGIQLSRFELESLIRATEGNFAALRALETVAKQSGWRISAPTADDFLKVIDVLRWYSELPIQHCPAGFGTEAAMVYEQTAYSRPDGSKYTNGVAFSSTAAALSAHRFNETLNGVVEAGETWSAVFVPEITELKPEAVTDATGEKTEISADEQHRTNVTEAAEKIGIAADPTIFNDGGASEREAARIRKELGLS